jgi:hypothetical protein
MTAWHRVTPATIRRLHRLLLWLTAGRLGLVDSRDIDGTIVLFHRRSLRILWSVDTTDL